MLSGKLSSRREGVLATPPRAPPPLAADCSRQRPACSSRPTTPLLACCRLPDRSGGVSRRSGIETCHRGTLQGACTPDHHSLVLWQSVPLLGNTRRSWCKGRGKEAPTTGNRCGRTSCHHGGRAATGAGRSPYHESHHRTCSTRLGNVPSYRPDCAGSWAAYP